MPLFLLMLAWLAPVAHGQAAPENQIPPHVLAEVALLENAFELALASDCNTKMCFPKGCAYVDHTVTDRPRRRSMPGLADEWGPGSVEAQEYLTRARCSFAHEESLAAEDVAALSRRLEARLSKGWVVVGVDGQKLAPLPAYVAEPPKPAKPEAPEEEEVEPAPPPSWGAELWAALLPHTWWMVLLAMGTFAVMVLIWAFRRVGQESLEDRMLLAEIEAGTASSPGAAESEAAALDEDALFVQEQAARWSKKLDEPDPEVQALLRDLLLARELPLLAKAVLRFPELTAAFPAGGDVATAKLELSETLKTVDPDDLPSDAEFFRALNRHALSAALAVQTDAQVVRSLREEFGAAGLVDLIGSLPARPGALLFALAPATEQQEMVGLFSDSALARLGEQLLASNRMDPAESAWLFEVVRAAREDTPRPAPPASTEVTDRGMPFDAVGPLSVLLPRLQAATRSQLFQALLARFGGRLPGWYRGLVLPDFLLALPTESRADLLLDVDAQQLAAWLTLLDPADRRRVLAGMPNALQASVSASTGFASTEQRLALAAEGRRALATGFQHQLARAGLSFDDVLRGGGGDAA